MAYLKRLIEQYWPALLIISICFPLCMLTPTREANAPDIADSPGQTNPGERLEYFQAIKGDYRDNRGTRSGAIKHIERQLISKESQYQRDAGIQQWEELGPDNEGGRVRALAVNPDDPNQLFAGGVGGGIWVSNNGGSTWSLSTSATLAYPVTSIAVDPYNGDIIYATTGEIVAGGGRDIPGIGILKSTNNGATWSVISVAPGTDFWLSKIIINPKNTNILYACGSLTNVNQANNFEAVYRSNDAGITWLLKFSQQVGGLDHVYDIEINPVDTNELYIGTDEDVFKSTDSGNSFNSMSGNTPTSPITTLPNGNPERCDISICSSDPDNVYVLRYILIPLDNDMVIDSSASSEIWYTSDAGDTWTMHIRTTGDNDEESTILNKQGWYDNIVWADPTNCSRAIFGGVNLWKWENSALTRISDDDDDIGGAVGGGNNSVHADQHAIVPHASYGASNSTVFIGNDGGVYKANNIWTVGTNSGWSSLVPGLSITQLYGVDVSLTGDTIYGGAQDNSFFVNRDMNSGTQDWVVAIRADGGHGAIKKSNPEIIYGTTQNGKSHKSTDGGDSYLPIFDLGNTSLGDDNPLFISPFEMDPNDDQTLYTGGERVWQSIDEGANWSIFKSDIITNRRVTTIEIAEGDGNKVWVGYTDGQFWRTSNGGSIWAREDDAMMPNEFVTDIAIHPADHNDILVSFGGGYDNDVIWYTDDGGVTWTNRSLPFDMLTYCIIWHPQESGWAYVGTDLGIFATEDYGENWSVTPLYSNHPTGNDADGPVFTPVTELVWQGDGSNDHPYYLVAATHGRGIWRTAFPIRAKYYVDKNCAPCGLGSFSQPYATFTEAVEAAGNGAEIVFLSPGTYNEVPASILLEKRIRVTLHSSVASPVVIE